MNFNGAVDKKYEESSIAEILKAPVSALQGLAQWADDSLKGMTIDKLATWLRFTAFKCIHSAFLCNRKFCEISEGLVTLAEVNAFG